MQICVAAAHQFISTYQHMEGIPAVAVDHITVVLVLMWNLLSHYTHRILGFIHECRWSFHFHQQLLDDGASQKHTYRIQWNFLRPADLTQMSHGALLPRTQIIYSL